MGLTNLTITTLKACKPVLDQHKKALGQTFYKKLFHEHPELRAMFNMSNGESQAASLANAVVAYCGNCDQLEVLGPTVAKIVHRHVSLDVQPEQYAVVGHTLLASLEEVLGKETFNAPVKEAVAEGYFFLADILKAEEVAMKEARRSAEGGWQGWRGFVLARKEVDTSLHSSFYLAPADGGAVAAHDGGQYLTMRLDLPGNAHPVVRSYTITGGGEGQYRVTVKREEKGLVSSFLHTELQPGDGLELSAPAGDFTLSPAPLPRVFVGAGTGITPLLAMMEEAAAQGDIEAQLIYRAHHPLLHPLQGSLQSLLERAPHLSATAQYTKPARRHTPHHRLSILPPSLPWSAETLGALLPTPCRVYVCGPPAFTTATLAILNKLGVDETNISYECFGPQA